MPLFNKKASPFSTKETLSDKRRTFRIVAFLAAASFLCMISGFYIDFIKDPTIQTTYYLVRANQTFPNETLINPQPPEKQTVPAEQASAAEENSHLIRQLEKERENIEQTAELLREIVKNSAEAPELTDVSVLPETPELQKLQQEKDLADQKKLEEIEALNKERLEKEKKKTVAANNIAPKDSALPKEEKSPEPSQKSSLSQKVYPKKEEKSSLHLSSLKSGLPPPDLIQTDLMASLPDFSLIKKSISQNAIPLHIIEPLPELLEETRYGMLPIESEGRTAFSAYGKQQSIPPASPYVAILFSGLGKRDNTTHAAIATLPDVISLSFSPYTDKLKTYIADARKAGHETLLDLPMQQGAFPETDPGPLGLVSGLPEQENRKRLRKVLGQNVAFIGLTAAANENFSYSGSQMKPFFDEIIQRGLIYIDGTDNPRMPIFKKALRPDVHIADEFHRAAIRARLEQTRKIALEKGSAFLRIEAVPITLLTVIEWMKAFAPTEQNPVPEISFVPLSYYASSKKEKE